MELGDKWSVLIVVLLGDGLDSRNLRRNGPLSTTRRRFATSMRSIDVAKTKKHPVAAADFYPPSVGCLPVGWASRESVPLPQERVVGFR